MKSCFHYLDAAACKEHRRLIADFKQRFNLPDKSMCASCRKAQPEKDAAVSEELLTLFRKAGAC